jgi:hypothetical protein
MSTERAGSGACADETARNNAPRSQYMHTVMQLNGGKKSV